MSGYTLVKLQVPYGYGPGQPITAVAPGGIKFKTFIPGGLHPGQFFTVRVPRSGGGEMEIKEHAPPSAKWSLTPTVTVGPDEYIKDIMTCSERYCDVSGCCGTWARFHSGKSELKFTHSCTCCPCIFKWNTNLDEKSVGSIDGAGCFDNPMMACLCPCCYIGDLISVIFYDPTDGRRFTTRRHVGCCQYCCIMCSVGCLPCFRCYKYCCTEDVYVKYEQDIFDHDLNNKAPVASIHYTERMWHPCCPNERLSLAIYPDPVHGKNISKEDLALLSSYIFLVQEGGSFQYMQASACILGSIAHPTGIESIDEANFIKGEWTTRDDALKEQRMN